MTNMRFLLTVALLAVIMLLTVACSKAQAKRPALKNTVWVCERQMFVADVGTMTETYTLKLLPGKQCILENKWVTPAHPATYMLADGTVETIPENSSESSSVGTWNYRRGKLTVTGEDIPEIVLIYHKDSLVSKEFYGQEATFVKR